MQFTMLVNVTLMGSSVHLEVPANPSRDDCESACREEPLCVGFSYVDGKPCEFFSDITGGKKRLNSFSLLKHSEDAKKISSVIQYLYKKLKGSELLGMERSRLKEEGSLEECMRECAMTGCPGFGFGPNLCIVYSTFDGTKLTNKSTMSYYFRIENDQMCDARVANTTLPTKIGNSSICGEGWGLFSANGEYYCTGKDKIPFHEANERCKAAGGLLTSVHSTAEVDYIRDLLGGTVPHWIGLVDVIANRSQLSLAKLKAQLKKKENWAWIDGSPMDFENWDPYNPDACCEDNGNLAGEAGYQGDKKMTWGDISVYSKYVFVCKRV